MTCQNSGEDLGQAVRNLVGATSTSPTLGGFLMSGVGARMDGEVFDPGLWDVANATGLVGLGQMGAAGYLANQGRRVSSALVQTPPGHHHRLR